VGGWNPKFYRQNPPPELLEIWAEKEARFNLMLASSLPRVVMAEPKITAEKDHYVIEVAVQNQGRIPTALRQAQLVKIVRPDTVSLEFPPGMIAQAAGGRGGRGGPEGPEEPEPAGRGGRGAGAKPQPPPLNPQDKVWILEPQDRRPTITIDRLAGGERKSAVFKIQFNGISGSECTVRYSSTRGGVVEKKIFIGK